jgi:acid phosphatase (class A)
MRHSNRVFLLFLFLLLPGQGWAQEAPFVTREQIDFSKLLAPPPTVGSPLQKQEMASLLILQSNRTPAQEAFAKADMERSVFRFEDAVGQGFTPEKLPKTKAFFKKIQENADYILAPAKEYWNRPRPYVTNPDIRPCVDKPDNASYPSGHSTFATVTSIILADMIPENQSQIYERAELFRLNREVGGAHYPSDVEAGRICGTVIAAFMLQNPAFQAEYAQAKAELRQVLGLK